MRADEKGVELIYDVAPDIPDVLSGDPGRLRQVVLNLIGNALKFTSVGEVVLQVDTIARTEEATRLRFSVTDTGIGIPPEKLTRIFQPFTQADGSSTRLYGGTGLGLSISTQLVAPHGRRDHGGKRGRPGKHLSTSRPISGSPTRPPSSPCAFPPWRGCAS